MAASSSNSVDVPSEITGADELKPKKVDPFEDMDNKEEIEKFKKYEADYANYLMAKYFSDKNIFGGNIFDVKMTMDGQTVKASRLPPYASYADPVGFLEEIKSESTSAAETPATTSTGNNSTKKST